MSSPEQALASLVSHLALSLDGAVLGVALAYAAVRSFFKFTANSAALRKIRSAPQLRVSDLRSLLPVSSEDQSQPSDSDPSSTLVIVRGTVEAKSAVDGSWKGLRHNNVLVSQESGDKAVVIQRTQTVCLCRNINLYEWILLFIFL